MRYLMFKLINFIAFRKQALPQNFMAATRSGKAGAGGKKVEE